MSIDDAVRIALLQNRSLRALYREVGIAQSDLVAAGLPENPVFDVERRFRGNAAEYDVTQEFLGIIFLPLKRRIAEQRFASERLRITHAVLEHAAEVRAAYYSLQAAMQLVEERRAAQIAAAAGLEVIASLKDAGNVALYDVSVEKRAFGRSQLAVSEAELALEESREKLHRLLGLSADPSVWKVPGTLPEIPAEDPSPNELEKLALEGRLDLEAASSELEALGGAKKLADRLSLFPDLTFGAHTEREPEGTLTAGPSLTLPIPLFNQGRAARSRAEYVRLQAEDRYAALATEIRAEARSAFFRMKLARKMVTYFREDVLPLEAMTLQQAGERYNAMFTGPRDLVRAREDQVEARSQHVIALRDYWLARTDLEKALGRRLLTTPGGEKQHES